MCTVWKIARISFILKTANRVGSMQKFRALYDCVTSFYGQMLNANRALNLNNGSLHWVWEIILTCWKILLSKNHSIRIFSASKIKTWSRPISCISNLVSATFLLQDCLRLDATTPRKVRGFVDYLPPCQFLDKKIPFTTRGVSNLQKKINLFYIWSNIWA